MSISVVCKIGMLHHLKMVNPFQYAFNPYPKFRTAFYADSIGTQKAYAPLRGNLGDLSF